VIRAIGEIHTIGGIRAIHGIRSIDANDSTACCEWLRCVQFHFAGISARLRLFR
jgi:hypothetical protein